jgi:hypothetical protein
MYLLISGISHPRQCVKGVSEDGNWESKGKKMMGGNREPERGPDDFRQTPTGNNLKVETDHRRGTT